MAPAHSWDTWLPDWSAAVEKPLSLLIGWETSGHHTQIRTLPIDKEVASDLTTPVATTLARLPGWSPVVYSPDLELDDNTYAVVERSQLDLTGTMLASAETSTPAEADPSDLSRPLLFYALAVGPPHARLVFVRQANPRAYLTKKWLGMWNDELVKVDKPVFSFDLDRVDLIVVTGQGLAVLNLKAFERLFQDSPELVARTPAKVKELSAQIELSDNAQAVLESVAQSNSRIRARLLATLNSGHLSAVKTSTLRAAMKQFGLDPAKHLKKGVLDFDAADAMAIMQLLNEDLSIGALSGTSYVINKKSPR